MKILLSLIICLSYFSSVAQIESPKYQISLKVGPNYNFHSDQIVAFPIGYTDASITPLNQEATVGYDISIAVRKEMNKYFCVGFSTYLSKFGFNETGDELSFWTNQIYEYQTNRNFTLFGLGIETGLNLYRSKTQKLQFQLGVSYEIIASKSGVNFPDEISNSKYSINNALEYGIKMSDRISLILATNSRIGLKNYYKNINYNPTRIGITVGAEYSIY